MKKYAIVLALGLILFPLVTHAQPAVCGNGVPEMAEECEPVPGMPGGGCAPGMKCVNCKCEDACGDVIFQPSVGEECDLSSVFNTCEMGKVCKDCKCVSCGNGVIDPDEECDPASSAAHHGCSTWKPLCLKDCKCAPIKKMKLKLKPKPTFEMK